MVYLFLAQGFEEIEALTPVDLLRRAGIDVTTVGVGGKTITGARGITVTADITDSEANPENENLEMVVLPGGMPGTKNLDACPVVDAFLTAAEKKNAWIAAICAAPMILGKRGLLRSHRATCYPGFETNLEGATIENTGVVTDGRIICGRAMGSATAFALALICALKGEAAAEEVRAAILA